MSEAYTETRSFHLRIELEAVFPEGYEGEEDEHGWAAAWDDRVRPSLPPLVMSHMLRQMGAGWKARTRNRGMSPADEVEIVLERLFDG